MKNDLHTAFIEQLKDIYDAEHRILEALPKLVKAAKADEVREAFEEHLEETRNHVKRLDKAFQSIDEKPERETCQAAVGLVKEGEEILQKNKDSDALDALLICAAQKVEHYEIATYGTLCTWAKTHGHDAALEQLKQNLEEEKSADEKLTTIAESVANLEPQRSH